MNSPHKYPDTTRQCRRFLMHDPKSSCFGGRDRAGAYSASHTPCHQGTVGPVEAQDMLLSNADTVKECIRRTGPKPAALLSAERSCGGGGRGVTQPTWSRRGTYSFLNNGACTSVPGFVSSCCVFFRFRVNQVISVSIRPLSGPGRRFCRQPGPSAYRRAIVPPRNSGPAGIHLFKGRRRSCGGRQQRHSPFSSPVLFSIINSTGAEPYFCLCNS